MELQLYRKDGELAYTLPVCEGSTYAWKLQESEYITINFNARQPLNITKGCYTDLQGIGRFEVVEEPHPSISTKGAGVEYELRLDRPWVRLGKRMLFFRRSETNGMEANFTITETLALHAQVIVDNITANNITYAGSNYTVVIENVKEANERKLITHNNTDILSALYTIAETFNCEVWFEQNVIKFGKCSNGVESIDLIHGYNLQNLTRSEDSNEHATRLYAFGSTRNLNRDYRQSDTTTAIQGLAEVRLQLPNKDAEGTPLPPYIESEKVTSEEDVVELVRVYDDIYPRALLRIKRIETFTYTETDTDTNEQTEWTAYRFWSEYNDPDVQVGSGDEFFFEDEYKSKNTEEKLSIHFETGELGGMDFEVIFDPEMWSDSEFEIVRNTNYTLPFPNESARPQVGDTFYMYNMDASAVSDLLIPQAEQELLRAAQADMADLERDSGTYTATLDKVEIAKEGLRVTYGQKVTLHSNLFFKEADGYMRESRVIGWNLNLANFADGEYTIGESAAYNKQRILREEVAEIAIKTGQIEASITPLPILRDGDTAVIPSDSNVNSAKRAENRYLSKVQDDRTPNVIASDKSFEIGTFSTGVLGAGGYFGMQQGQSYLEVDQLRVRREASFLELAIEKISHVGGQVIISPASAKITRVSMGANRTRCYFDNTDNTITINNQFQVDDLAICQTYNNSSLRYWWARVTGVGANYIDISTTDRATNSTRPRVGDEVVQLGNVSDTTRQSAIVLSSVGTDAPSIKLYRGINSYDLTDKLHTWFSAEGNCIRGQFVSEATGKNIDEIYAKTIITQDGRTIDLSALFDGLRAAGITIDGENSTINATADKFAIFNQGGEQTFGVDANGNIYGKTDEDGNMRSGFVGKITAESGKVGGFDINQFSLSSSTSNENENYTMTLSSGLIAFRDQNTQNTALIGSETIPAQAGGITSCPAMFTCQRQPDNNYSPFINIALTLQAENAPAVDDYPATGSHALFITKGDICGLRLKVRRISSSTTLTDMDTMIIVTQGGVTLALPSSPQDGQLYYIKFAGASGNVTVIPGQNNHYINTGRINRSTFITWSSGAMFMLVWDSVNNVWTGGYLANQ